MKPWLTRIEGAVDSGRDGRSRPRTAEAVLGIGMLLSAVFALWLGRNVSFTVDEYSWISLSGESGLSRIFEPYVGHLVAIPRGIYWVVLETVGVSSYALFQVLALLSLFLMVGLLFAWLRRRVPDFVALAPCLVLLIFPVDHLHYLTGNGVTISLALAFGIAALLAWEQGTRGWDVAAFGFLVLGLLTYTIAAPFAIGLVVAAVISRNWSRIWVGLLPLVAYGIWRLVAVTATVEKIEGGPDWDNLLLLPAWTFQSVGAVLAAMTGLGFDFTNLAGGPAVEQGRTLGPVLATVAVLALGWWFWKGRRVDPSFWVTTAILLALFTSQVLVWGTIEARDPGAPRYLLPGAALLVLVVGALLRDTGWRRTPFVVLWVVAAGSVLVSIGILAKNTEWLETVEVGARAEITAIRLVESSGKKPLPPALQPRNRIRNEFRYRSASKYGDLGFYEEDLRSEEGWVGKRVDVFLAKSLRIGLRPLPPGDRPSGCAPATGDREPAPWDERLRLPNPGVVLRSRAEVVLALGRYGSWPAFELGTIGPGTARKLWLPGDRGTVEWYIKAKRGGGGTLADLDVCDFP